MALRPYIVHDDSNLSGEEETKDLEAIAAEASCNLIVVMAHSKTQAIELAFDAQRTGGVLASSSVNATKADYYAHGAGDSNDECDLTSPKRVLPPDQAGVAFMLKVTAAASA